MNILSLTKLLGRQLPGPATGQGPKQRPAPALALALLLLIGLAAACSPTVQLAAPTEPIHIKLDVKIEHEIRVKVEQQLDKLLSPESGLF